MNTIVVTCMNDNCDRQFRIPEYNFNSTIKNNPEKQECLICKNKKILAQSTLYAKNKRTKAKPYKTTTKKAEGKKTPKNASKKRTHWTNKELTKMIRHVQYLIMNPYIRERDKECFNNKCISCNSKISQAGHRYSVGDFPGMRFMINNCHGQEISCNHHKSGNIDAYDRGLIERFDKRYLEKLKEESLKYLHGGFKWYSFDVIQIGKTYEYLHKNKIWIFSMEKFNEYRDIVNKNLC